MKIRDNAPAIYSTFQDQALRAPSIEDGNSPVGEIQGKIFTSEITSADDYSVSYIATLLSAPTANLRETGTLNTYTFSITYDATLEPAPATNPGLFGSNIIKEGDPFVVKSPSPTANAHDWIRGYVSKINNVSFTVLGSVYSYTYTLSCTVTQGQPLDMKIGDNFLWNRQLYQDPSTFNNAVPPINFTSSYNRSENSLYFYWDDVNQESRSYRIMARLADDSSGASYTIYHVPGRVQNPEVSLTPFVAAGTVKTIKINDTGVNSANALKPLKITGSGTGCTALAFFGSNGSLVIHEFTVYEATVGTPYVFIYSNETVDRIDNPLHLTGWPRPNVGSYVDKLPKLSGTSDFYVGALALPFSPSLRYTRLTLREAGTGNLINITPAWRSAILNTKINLHDGVVLISGGTYTGKVLASPIKTQDRPRAYFNTQLQLNYPAGAVVAFSVSAIYDEINKLYTEWSTEEYIKF